MIGFTFFLAALGGAKAACGITDLRPTTVLPTASIGQSFTFVATNDCEALVFEVEGSMLTKIPRPGPAVGLAHRRYSVTLRADEWESITGPKVTTVSWIIKGTSACGI